MIRVLWNGGRIIDGRVGLSVSVALGVFANSLVVCGLDPLLCREGARSGDGDEEGAYMLISE